MGTGPRNILLIPGLGFSAEVFTSLMERFADTHTMYAVTLPGFGGTPSPPTPPETTSFGEQTWTNGALAGLEELMDREGLQELVVVGHWLTGTQLALRLALKYPNRIAGVILIAGSPRWVPPPTDAPQQDIPLSERIAGIDRRLAPQWFKTVTRETWDDNNFLPSDYATNPVLGLRLWRAAARPPLHVWIRYLCEFLAQDITLALDTLATPTLLLQPDMQGAYHDPGSDYMTAYTATSWGTIPDTHSQFRKVIVPNARVAVWVDRPGFVRTTIAEFLSDVARNDADVERPR